MANQLLSDSIDLKSQGNNHHYRGTPITETVANGFFAVDQQWTVTYWNNAAEKILGVTAEEMIGKNLWEKFAGIFPIEFYRVYHKAFLQDVPVHFEEYWGEKSAWFDVITYHCDNSLCVSFKSSSQPANPQDTQQKLQALNELYKFVTEVTNDCLWEWDLQNKEIFWIDGGHKRVFGYPIENALIPQRFWESCIHPEDLGRVLTSLDKIISASSQNQWEAEYRFKKANGEYAYVCDRGHIIYNDEKVAVRMIGATQDISSRRMTEIQLLESERKLSLIARQTGNAVLMTDPEGKITWVNNAFVQITEYSLEEVIGKKPGSFLQGEGTDPNTVNYIRQKMAEKKPFHCDILNYTKSGRKYWMHIQGQAILDESGDCKQYFAIETDITEKVLREEKVVGERLARQKEITNAVLTAQENERADIGKELHDNLNQILVASKMYIEMARKHEGNRDLYLRKSSGYIVTVIEEIRKIAKTLSTPGIFIGLVDSIKNLINDITGVHPIKIELETNGFEDHELDIKVQLDVYRIVQEQMNNILKHAKANRAKIQIMKNENEIALFITDNGVGWDHSGEKSGMGITNIKSRAELYSGRVTIITEPGKGYELEVALPLPGHK